MKLKTRKSWLSFSVLLFWATGCSRPGTTDNPSYSAAGALPPLVRVSVENKSRDLLVLVVMRNSGPSSFPLLKWNLPDDGNLTTNLFEVRRDGQRVEYRGLMVKRAVTNRDYMLLRPGQDYAARIGSAQGYDIGPKGHYTIQFRASNQSLDGSSVVELTSKVSEVDKD
jgi:hypothetical protein